MTKKNFEIPKAIFQRHSQMWFKRMKNQNLRWLRTPRVVHLRFHLILRRAQSFLPCVLSLFRVTY